MFKIGEFSKLSRISIRMLRHYDEIGLLVPEHIDPWTGYRQYAAAQLLTASRITASSERRKSCTSPSSRYSPTTRTRRSAETPGSPARHGRAKALKSEQSFRRHKSFSP